LLLILSFCNYIPTLNVKKGVLYGRPTNFSWGLTPLLLMLRIRSSVADSATEALDAIIFTREISLKSEMTNSKIQK